MTWNNCKSTNNILNNHQTNHYMLHFNKHTLFFCPHHITLILYITQSLSLLLSTPPFLSLPLSFYLSISPPYLPLPLPLPLTPSVSLSLPPNLPISLLLSFSLPLSLSLLLFLYSINNSIVLTSSFMKSRIFIQMLYSTSVETTWSSNNTMYL